MGKNDDGVLRYDLKRLGSIENVMVLSIIGLDYKNLGYSGKLWN